MKVLLDTHCLIKLVLDEKLSSRVRKLILEATELIISPISAWEIAMLEKLGYIELDRPALNWYTSALLERRVRQVDLSPEILMDSVFLDWTHRDPADRIIVATALNQDAVIATEDAQMLKYLG